MKRFSLTKSFAKIFLAVFFVGVSLSAAKTQETRSYFLGADKISGSFVSSGHWIPKVKVKVFPEKPDGDKKWYGKRPCVKIYSDVGKSTVYYSFFEGKEPKSAEKYAPGECVPVPEGEWHFMAQAENDDNPKKWKSEKVFQEFFVDTEAPEVKIEKPDSREELFGKVKISVSVKDLNPEKFWLSIDDEGGKEISKSEKFKKDESFSKKNVFVWDTKDVPDGEYSIQLRAADRFGHENLGGSEEKNQPDKIWVRVKNGENSSGEESRESVFEMTEDDFSSNILPQEEVPGEAGEGGLEEGLST